MKLKISKQHKGTLHKGVMIKFYEILKNEQGTRGQQRKQEDHSKITRSTIDIVRN